ncbi:MAG: DM13 domain-containing protein [Pseudanabaenales cyanobacterium]|nr:DM13 domain-containing protein [Pseudanabaenales cyanobacterium]
MKLNRLKTIAITSTLLLGGLGSLALNPAYASPETTASQVQVAANSILASGDFVTVEPGHPTAGTARIIVENGQRYLEFDQTFGTANGPDVVVVLHRDAVVPLSLNEADYISLAPLQSFNGAQRYAIPANVDLDQYNSAAIWCRQFNITFGYAAL